MTGVAHTYYKGERSPPTALVVALAELRVGLNALENDPESGALHDACAAKLAHFARLTAELELDGQIRKAGRHHVMETARRLQAMPGPHRRSRDN